MRLVIALVMACVSGLAIGADYLPFNSTASGKEIARMSRLDGSSPSKERAATDKLECTNEPKSFSAAQEERINALIKTDREAAEIEIFRGIAPCLAKRGWRVVLALSDTALTSEPDRATIAVVDATLDKFRATLPKQMDELSDLIDVRRERLEVVWISKVRPEGQAKVDELRTLATRDPQGMASIRKSLMKQTVCEPEPNRYLKDGFTMIWEMVDAEGRPLSRQSLTLADCK
jgi:hypothetical protein